MRLAGVGRVVQAAPRRSAAGADFALTGNIRQAVPHGDARACFLRQPRPNEEKKMKAGVTKIGAAVAIAEEKSIPAKETLKREFLDSLF